MNTYSNLRIIAATALVCSACVTVKDLGDVEEAMDTEGEDGTMDDGSGDEDTGDPTGDPTGDSDSDTGMNPPMPGVGPAAVDILFVIDNSGSMGEEQGLLAQAIPSLVSALDTTGLDYRIGVTTTDNGNYWCRGAGISNPEAGNLVFSSCRERLDEFLFAADDVDARYACTDSCPAQWESIVQTATSTANDPEPRRRPWIENIGGVTNLPAGLDPATALQCLLPQGINGCGFESHLESMYKGMRRAEEEVEDEFDFIREDAHLMVVILSDEADCSFNSEWEAIFYPDTEGGNQVFWSLPDEQQSPTSAVCWNAGTRCTGNPAAYDDCVPQDYDINGNTTVDPDDAVLFPLARYADKLAEIRAAKAGSHAQLFLFGILGVPDDYGTSRTITYSQGPTPSDPSSFQAKFGIGPGCSGDFSEAVPPVRMRALLEDEAITEGSPLHSICSDGSYGSAFTAMVAQVNSFVGI